MKGYKTSKDYKRLKEMLDNGYSIIFFKKNGAYPSIAKKDSEGYWFWECGLAELDNEYAYLYLCHQHDIEFIEPTEELK